MKLYSSELFSLVFLREKFENTLEISGTNSGNLVSQKRGHPALGITWPGEVWLLCSVYHESLRTWIKTIVNKFAISNHTAFILSVYALRSYLKLICEYELHSLPNKKS